MVVIEITGRAGAGKTTLARLLSKELANLGYSSAFLSFASPLKKFLRKLGITKSFPLEIEFESFDLFLQDLKNSLQNFLIYHNTYIDDYELSKYIELHKNILEEAFYLYFKKRNYKEGFRLFAQTIGTEIIRNINSSFFVSYLVNQVEKLVGIIDIVFIDDFRFPNEDLELTYKRYDYPLFKVFKLRIKSDENENYNHSSESFTDTLKVHCEVVRNGNQYEPSFISLVKRLLEEIQND